MPKDIVPALQQMQENIARSAPTIRPPSLPTAASILLPFAQKITVSVFNSMMEESQKATARSAARFEQEINSVARYATSAEDFKKRVDTEVTPHYKRELSNSQMHREVLKNVPAIGREVDRHMFEKAKDAAGALLLNEIADMRETSVPFADFNAKAQAAFKDYTEKWGVAPPALVANYQGAVVAAARSYTQGAISKTLSLNASQMTHNYIMGGSITTESAVDFIENQLKPAVETPDSDTWKGIIVGAIDNIVQNVPDAQTGEAIVKEMGHYLTPQQRILFDSKAKQTANINRLVEQEQLKENAKVIQNQLDLGLTVPPESIYLPRQREENEFLNQHDVSRMNGLDLARLDRPDIANRIYQRMQSDFAKDFKSAYEARNPGQIVEPLILPSIATNEIKDRQGNILVSKGSLQNMELFLDSVQERGVIYDKAALIYGSEVVTHRFSPAEAQQIQSVFQTFNPMQKLEFGYKLHESLKQSRTVNTQHELEFATGSAELAGVVELMNTDTRFMGKRGTIPNAYLNYEEMAAKNDEEFKRKTDQTIRYLNDPMGRGTMGVLFTPQASNKIMTGWITDEMKTTIHTLAVGGSRGLSYGKKYDDYLTNNIQFWTKNMQYLTMSGYPLETTGPEPSAAEAPRYTLGDLFHDPTVSVGAWLTQSTPTSNNAAQVGAVFLSNHDYRKFSSALGRADVVLTSGRRISDVTGFRAIDGLLRANPTATVMNYNNKFNQFILVTVNNQGMMKPFLDSSGNEIVFSID